MTKILLIDDDEKLGDLLGTYFERFDLTLLVANEPAKGLEVLGKEDPDLVILDVMLPGQDGFDYPFEVDYFYAWETMIDVIRELADYDPSVRIGLEYKLKEPRVHCYISTIGKTILLIQATERTNVGVFLDTGHAILAYENVAESFALTKVFGDRLFGVHINDTRRDWDWDMNVGSVHLLDTMEWLYWVDKIGFDGFYTLDIWPARMDSLEAIQECIAWTKEMRKALMRIGEKNIEEMIAEGNPAKSMKVLREAIFK